MSNSYFQFKQFTIHQDRCAMKVCTDACLFGAWVAGKVDSWEMTVDSILDIGTGTGLLSLMLAQKTNASVDAIEVDENAARQAAENFSESKWHNRLKVIHGDAKSLPQNKKYALIISNPPFFENDLKSADPQRNLALHSKELSLQELLGVINQNLSDDGKFAVLLPWHRKNEFEKLALSEGFYMEEMLAVKQTAAHSFFRVLFLFGRKDCFAKENEMAIKINDQYSEGFVDLLKEYYLKL